MNLFGAFDFGRLGSHLTWIIITFGAMIISMAIDLVTGVMKAKKAGIDRRSKGFRMTCDKAERYFLPYLCAVCMDLIGSVLLDAPYFSMLYGSFCIFCEWKSVFENTNTKEQMRQAASTMNVVVQNHDDIAKIITETIKQLEGGKDEKDENSY